MRTMIRRTTFQKVFQCSLPITLLLNTSVGEANSKQLHYRRFSRSYPNNVGTWNSHDRINSYGWDSDQPVDECNQCSRWGGRQNYAPSREILPPVWENQMNYGRYSPEFGRNMEYRGNGYDNLSPEWDVRQGGGRSKYPVREWQFVSSSSERERNMLRMNPNMYGADRRSWDSRNIYPVKVDETSSSSQNSYGSWDSSGKSGAGGIVPGWLGGMGYSKYNNNDAYDNKSKKPYQQSDNSDRYKNNYSNSYSSQRNQFGIDGVTGNKYWGMTGRPTDEYSTGNRYWSSSGKHSSTEDYGIGSYDPSYGSSNDRFKGGNRSANKNMFYYDYNSDDKNQLKHKNYCMYKCMPIDEGSNRYNNVAHRGYLEQPFKDTSIYNTESRKHGNDFTNYLPPQMALYLRRTDDDHSSSPDTSTEEPVWITARPTRYGGNPVDGFQKSKFLIGQSREDISNELPHDDTHEKPDTRNILNMPVSTSVYAANGPQRLVPNYWHPVSYPRNQLMPAAQPGIFSENNRREHLIHGEDSENSGTVILYNGHSGVGATTETGYGLKTTKAAN